MDAEPEPRTSGKRKVRGAKCARGSTKKRELEAVEESGTLPPPSKHLQALDAALQSSSFLPPIKGSLPPAQPMKDNWMEKVGLDVHEEPPPPSAVQTEKTPEKTLDAVFSARLLGNETPEPEHEQVSSEDEEKTLLGDPEDSKILRFFKKTAEELVRWLESIFCVRVSELYLYEHLVTHLMEEVEILAWIKVTFGAPDGRLFPDDIEAVSFIVSEVYKDFLKNMWILEMPCFNQGTICYITNTVLNAFVDYTMSCCKAARTSPDTEERSQGEPEVQEVCSTVLSQRSPSEFEELIRELGGSPDAIDLSDDECSEILTGFQTYRYSLMKRPIRNLTTGAESPLEGRPDSSSSIPAVQVTEASEDSEVENNEDLEVPACPDGATDSTKTGTKKKWKKLRTRVSSFLRRVFCFGCLPSRRLVPL